MSDEHRFAWQGWDLVVPCEWDPVRLEGDFDKGYALLSDLHRPRLGLRWQKVSGKATANDAIKRQIDRALREEVGTLAAELARDASDEHWPVARLFVEPDPPGRDVFIGFSAASQRLVQVVYQVEKPRPDRMLSEKLVRVFRDRSAEDEQTWAVFELIFRLERSLRLVSQKLLAGDLSLTFQGSNAPKTELTMRQIAVASLALKRMPIEKWLRQQQATRAKHYRPAREHAAAELAVPDGRSVAGVRGVMRRRRRFFFLRRLPRELVTLALHDEARDRLVIVQSNDEDLARRTAATVGSNRE